MWSEYGAGCTENCKWPYACGHRPSHPYNAEAERGDTTKATVKVVGSSSKENVETEKHTPPVCRFKVDKHIQPRHLLYYVRSTWDHPVAHLVYEPHAWIVWSSENALGSNQPLEEQNDTGFWIRQQNERASTISHEITGAQGNTLKRLINCRKDFNLRSVNFDRTECIRRAIVTDRICSVYRRQVLDTCPPLALTSNIVYRSSSSRSPRWSCISKRER